MVVASMMMAVVAMKSVVVMLMDYESECCSLAELEVVYTLKKIQPC